MRSIDENEELDDPINLMQDKVEVCIGFKGAQYNFIKNEHSNNDTGIKEDEDNFDIERKIDICVVDKISGRALETMEHFIDRKQKQTGNVFYKTDHIISNNSYAYVPQGQVDQIDVANAAVCFVHTYNTHASKENKIDVGFKDVNDLIDSKVRSRIMADDTVSDNEEKMGDIKSKDKESNKGPNIERCITLLKKALTNIGAEVTSLDGDINNDDDDECKNNNNVLNSNFNYIKQSSQKGGDYCREEQDYSNTLRKNDSSTLKNNICLKSSSSHEEENQIGSKITDNSTKDNTELMNKFSRQENLVKCHVISSSSSSIIPYFNIQEVQNNIVSTVKTVQDNLQSENQQIKSIKIEAMPKNENVSCQKSGVLNNEEPTYKVYSHNFYIKNGSNIARTNSFVTTGNITQVISQPDVNKLQDGYPIQTVSNRSENIENNEYVHSLNYANKRKSLEVEEVQEDKPITKFSLEKYKKCSFIKNIVVNSAINNINETPLVIEEYVRNEIHANKRKNLEVDEFHVKKLVQKNSLEEHKKPSLTKNTVMDLTMNNINDISIVKEEYVHSKIHENKGQSLEFDKMHENDSVKKFSLEEHKKQLFTKNTVLDLTSNDINERSVANDANKRKSLEVDEINEKKLVEKISLEEHNKPRLTKNAVVDLTKNDINAISIVKEEYVHSKSHVNERKSLEFDKMHEKKLVKKISLEEHNKPRLTQNAVVDLTMNNINAISIVKEEYVHSKSHANKRKSLEFDKMHEKKLVKKNSLEEHNKPRLTKNAVVDLTMNNINAISIVEKEYVHSKSHANKRKSLEFDKMHEKKLVKKISLEEHNKPRLTKNAVVDLTMNNINAISIVEKEYVHSKSHANKRKSLEFEKMHEKKLVKKISLEEHNKPRLKKNAVVDLTMNNINAISIVEKEYVHSKSHANKRKSLEFEKMHEKKLVKKISLEEHNKPRLKKNAVVDLTMNNINDISIVKNEYVHSKIHENKRQILEDDKMHENNSVKKISNNINERSVANDEYVHSEKHVNKRKSLEVDDLHEEKLDKEIPLVKLTKHSFTINTVVDLAIEAEFRKMFSEAKDTRKENDLNS